MKIKPKEIINEATYIDPTIPLQDVPLERKALRFVFMVGRVFWKTYGFQRAGALAFATLFGIFPLVGVLLFLIPVFFGDVGMETVGKFILTSILPQAGNTLETTFESYVQIYQTNATQIGVLGLFALFIAGIALFIIVEQSFNDIWRVERRRSFLKASTVFAGVIVWIPLFIGLSLYLSTAFVAPAQAESKNFIKNVVLPPVLFFIGMSFAYMLIPNTRVNVSSALAGALFSAILWNLARTLFDRSIKIFPAYNLIQSVGVVPYFLVWLYINWVIILFGVIIAYSAQNYHFLLRENLTYTARILDPVVLLVMLFYAGKQFVSGKGAVNLSDLRNLCPIPPSDFAQHVDYLERNGFIARVGENDAIILAQPPEKIPLKIFLQFFSKAKTMFHLSLIDKEGEQFLTRLREMDEKLGSSLSDKSLAFFLA